MHSSCPPLLRAWVALVACLGLALVLLGPPAGRAAASAGLQRQPSETLPVQVAVSAVEPAVIGPGQPWRVTGTVRNVSAAMVPVAEVRVHTAYRGLDTRAALTSWATGESGLSTNRLVGTAALGLDLAPGASRPFSIEVAADAVDPGFDFATLPLTVEVSGAEGLGGEGPRGRVRTFLPWYAVDSPDPTLQVSWVVPLTLPADTGLTDADPVVRIRAWVDAIGPDSAVQTWLTGLAERSATFVIDPALLVPVVPGGELTGPTGTPPGEGTGPTAAPPSAPADPAPTADAAAPSVPPVITEIDRAEVALQDELAGLDPEQLWWLPVNDPDLAALIDQSTDPALVSKVLSAALPDSDLRAASLLRRGRHDVAWPVWDRATEPALTALRDVWSAAGRPELAGVVVPGPALEVPLDNAAGTVTGGPTLLRFDPTLSAVASGAGATGRSGESVQRLVAELLAVHQQLGPAVDRSVLIAPPRGSVPDPETLRSVVAAVDAAPWLRQTPAGDLLTGAPSAQLTGNPLPPAAPGDPTAYPVAGASPLSDARIGQIEELRAAVGDVASVLPTTEAVPRWGQVLDGLYSSRWRTDATSFAAPLTDLGAQVEDVLGGVQVNPTQVNFLADEGLIQMTVVNRLPTPVEDLTLHIEPGNGRLRILEQPEPITIGPESRATVTFRARAIASGEVPVRAYLTTPGGARVGDEQVLQVQVNPTGAWIYWLLGGVAGVILVLGLARALRRPPRAAATGATAAPDPERDTQ